MTDPQLSVDGTPVARYVLAPDLDARHGPRPYLHPVRTLAGTPVTDALPADHVWHLGASLAVQDVAGTNLWGGRTRARHRVHLARRPRPDRAHRLDAPGRGPARPPAALV
ncbi:DUF6807 family protein [Verrucosispora sioxanthis]|uniref:DUF6807 family protein n=1 Tax=Verrucosispora sioxanthis TaxID=2499994 RepID=UPI002E2D4AD7|nr:DUF6807 family protein [Verrucosispora sioxanthis]